MLGLFVGRPPERDLEACLLAVFNPSKSISMRRAIVEAFWYCQCCIDILDWEGMASRGLTIAAKIFELSVSRIRNCSIHNRNTEQSDCSKNESHTTTYAQEASLLGTLACEEERSVYKETGVADVLMEAENIN